MFWANVRWGLKRPIQFSQDKLINNHTLRIFKHQRLINSEKTLTKLIAMGFKCQNQDLEQRSVLLAIFYEMKIEIAEVNFQLHGPPKIKTSTTELAKGWT